MKAFERLKDKLEIIWLYNETGIRVTFFALWTAIDISVFSRLPINQAGIPILFFMLIGAMIATFRLR